MMRVLAIGHAALDITLSVDDYPKENTKTKVGSTICCSGGAATNAAFLLAKWKVDTYLSALVGEDPSGEAIKKELIDASVHIDYVKTSPHFNTTISYVIANQKNGSRTIVTSKTKQQTLEDISYREEEISGIIADGEEEQATLIALEKYPNAISVLDAGSLKPSMLTIGKKVDYFISSKDFVEEYCNITLDPNDRDSLVSCYLKLQNEINPNVIVTLGEYGSFTSYKGEYHFIPSIQVKSLDTTASGDLFHGAFLYFMMQQVDYLSAIRRANITGALASRFVGRNHSIPTLEEVLEVDST